MARFFILALVVLISPAWAYDVALRAGAALHAAPHPGYEEPLGSPPLLFAAAGLEIEEQDSALGLDLAAGPSGRWLDWETSLSFRHTLAVDWGSFAPYLSAGVGWVARSSLDTGGLEMAALFPEAGFGVRAHLGALALDASLSYRPVPVPLPFLAADPYPIRRLAAAVQLVYFPGVRGRK